VVSIFSVRLLNPIPRSSRKDKQIQELHVLLREARELPAPSRVLKKGFQLVVNAVDFTG
jgi:hypothetical protein